MCLVVRDVKHLVSLRLPPHYPQTSVGKLLCRRGGVHPNRLSHHNWGGTRAVQVMNSATSDQVRLEGSSWSKHREVHCLLRSGALWTWTGRFPWSCPLMSDTHTLTFLIKTQVKYQLCIYREDAGWGVMPCISGQTLPSHCLGFACALVARVTWMFWNLSPWNCH